MTHSPVPPARHDAPDPQFRRGVLAVGGGTLISVAALFVETVIVARALPIGDMGLYAVFQATLGLLLIVVDLGFRTTAAQFLARQSDPGQQAALVSTLTWLRLAVLAVLAAAWLLVVPALTGGTSTAAGRLLVWMPAVLALASLDELLAGMLQGLRRFRPLAAAQVLRSLLRLGLSGWLLLGLGRGLESLVVSWVVSFGASAGLQFLALPARPGLHLDTALARAALRFGLPVNLTRYLWFGMQRADLFVLSALSGPVGVALYDVAGRVPQGLQRLSEAYYAVYHPSLSNALARRDRAASGRLMARSLRLFSAGTLAAAWGGVLFGQDLIVALFGSQYAPAGPVFTLMLVAFSLGASLNLLGYALTASGRPGRSFAVNLMRTAASLAGDLALIPFLGVAGAAYATLGAQLAAAPLAWAFVRDSRLPAHGRLLAGQFALAAALLAAHWWLPALTAGWRAALLAAFPIAVLALGLVRPDDLNLVLPDRIVERFDLAAGPKAPAARHIGGTEA
jgi:O-antigen/teichoic acid export membrane protein